MRTEPQFVIAEITERGEPLRFLKTRRHRGELQVVWLPQPDLADLMGQNDAEAEAEQWNSYSAMKGMGRRFAAFASGDV